jgi:hypothetical protein
LPWVKRTGVKSRPEDEKRRHPHECWFFESFGFAVSTALPVVEVALSAPTEKLITLKSSVHLSFLALLLTF